MPRLALMCAAILLMGCTTNPEKRVPRAAADAMTGSPWTLTAVASLTMEGSGMMREVRLEDGSQFTVTSFRRVLNFRKRQWRDDMTVVSDSPSSPPERISMGLIGGHPFRQNTERDRDPQLPSEVLRHPIGFLQAAFSGTLPLSSTRTIDGLDAVDLTVDGEVYTLFIDKGTNLPAKILTTHQGPMGAVTTETAFPAYKTIHGYKLPSRVVTKLNTLVVEDLKIEQQVASADTIELTTPNKL